MIKQLKHQFIFALIFFLCADLLALYLTTTHPSSIPKNLESHLHHNIDVIDQIRINETEFILYHDLATSQLDVAWYEPNEILFWRYHLSGMYATTKGAHVNRCQTYQTSDYFLLWGINEDLQGHSLKVILNNETFIENISQDPYFFKIYPLNHQFPEVIHCFFYNNKGENISTYFFKSFNQ